MKQEFWKNTIDISNEESLGIMDMLKEHGDIGSLFRIGLCIRRIDVDSESIDVYKGNTTDIIDQVIGIIETSIFNYKSFMIHTIKNVPVSDPHKYTSSLLISDTVGYNFYKNNSLIQTEITNFLRTKGIIVSDSEYIDVDSHYSFNETINKMNILKSFNNLDVYTSALHNINDFDIFYQTVIEKQKEILNDMNNTIKNNNSFRLYFKILTDEIVYLLYRINIFLLKYGNLIDVDITTVPEGTILKFFITSVTPMVQEEEQTSDMIF